MSYTPPSFKSTSFNCPSCGAFARQHWLTICYSGGGGYTKIEDMKMSSCEHCKKSSFWFNEKMIIPEVGNVMMANSDLPEDIIEDYNEARSILSKSPRGASALLRLAIQKLCIFLGEEGKNINEDIANLVKKGLPVKIQQSLDILRVVGNNAVHPGQIDLKDNFELCVALFGLINIIADVMISQPKHVEALYGNLPQNLVDAIEKRDSKA
ncbi:DUF4145 domain-containing protein [Flavobacterium sp. JAS]|uniref:DUF4145 domain-containing protein n=1 Tax=Flavobacterium sp. JAS TaxID=2897329 RepID=UPI001E3C7497|nr:DUF4145 domain-containing protein [Flavobacterium sp. JAS]MCD0470722.1 DUF4145 domain-containing protein [Flavobacterium sp. JAS]